MGCQSLTAVVFPLCGLSSCVGSNNHVQRRLFEQHIHFCLIVLTGLSYADKANTVINIVALARIVAIILVCKNAPRQELIYYSC